ncbi:MAG: hypothetical protein M3131_08430 [Actinomycetota bacterium]|nr:hypothetical protein [Actinomycetota bacterium]
MLGVPAVELDKRIAFLKAIGVDRLRVSVFWNNVAPAKFSQTKPTFPAPGPGFPGSYPRGAWEPYDNIAPSAKRHGLDLLFTITGPAPAWATPGSHGREGLFRPDPRDFQEFATAVGLRYSGAYPVNDRFTTQSEGRQPLRIGGLQIGANQQPQQPAPRLPRVDGWSIWNEPNFPTWLSPIWLANRPKRPKDMVAAAPHHYRKLLDAAWTALEATGHENDLILIGETAPRGAKKPSQLGNAMAPAEFARELYCLKENFRAYSGRAARARDCPVDRGQRRSFRQGNPALFRARGYAHHPYSLDRRRWRKPTWRHPMKDNVPIGNLRCLISTLDRATFYWGSQREPMSMWITEYGYQTTPPDPIAGVAPARQGPLTSWGEYMAYRNRRVASVAQFLYVDDKPVPGYSGRHPQRWITWQSGLFAMNGAAKPFAADYLRPIHTAQRGRSVRIFGGYRPAPTGAAVAARLEYSRGGGQWQTLRNVTVTNPRGYVSTRVRVPGAGFVRIMWRDPASGASMPSRAMRVR